MKKSTSDLSTTTIIRDILSSIPIETFSEQVNFIAIIFAVAKNDAVSTV